MRAPLRQPPVCNTGVLGQVVASVTLPEQLQLRVPTDGAHSVWGNFCFYILHEKCANIVYPDMQKIRIT